MSDKAREGGINIRIWESVGGFFMSVWEHGVPGLAFFSWCSNGSCATITLAFALVALLYQGNFHRHICNEQQKLVFCTMILCSYWVGTRKYQTYRMARTNDLFIQTASRESVMASMKSGRAFPKMLRKLSQINLICQMSFIGGFTICFILVCEYAWIKDQQVHMQVLKDQVLVILPLLYF